MAATWTVVPDSENVMGRWRGIMFDVLLDNAYPLNATSGYPVSAARLGFTFIFGGMTLGGTPVASNPDFGKYDITYDATNKTVRVFRTAGFTPAGTISGNVTVTGGGIGEAIGINPDSNAGALAKAAATTRTIPIATFLGAAPTFTGTAVAAGAGVEVANGIDLSTVNVRLLFVGR